MSVNYHQQVQEYWEKPDTVSIIDTNLHQLEIATVCRHLLPTDVLADVGCGNGEATIQYARRVRQAIGFERSTRLREQAVANGRTAGLRQLTFEPGDILQMGEIQSRFDVVVSQRMLINLGSWEEQQQGLTHLHRMLKPGGRAILVENTNDAAQALNDVRTEVGLTPIPQHWHNRFFDRERFDSFLEGRFQLLKFYDFGFYYLLTRVYTQMFASFQGFGAQAVKDPIFESADRAARILFERLGDRIEIKGCRALGPIQVWVLRREGTDPA